MFRYGLLETVNKATSRTSSVNPRQQWAHQLERFQTLCQINQNFLIYLAKYWWSVSEQIFITAM